MSDEQTLEGIKVTRLGRGVYQIRSETQKDVVYEIDILANDGLGNCSCKNFQFSRLPKFERLGIPFDSFRCKHLKRVRCHVLDLILSSYIQKETQTQKSK